MATTDNRVNGTGVTDGRATDTQVTGTRGRDPSTAPTVRQFRHRAEVPMIVITGLLAVAALIVALVIALGGGDEPGWLKSAVVGIVAAPIVASLFFIRYSYWSTISNCIQVTETQLPDLYRLYDELAREMGFSPDGEGLEKTPLLYVKNGNGVMNAYATKCKIRRGYIVLHSDILDLAYTHGHFDTIRFVLAHELGHIKCRHVSLWRVMLQPIARLLLIGKSLTRAQEYTADRVGGYYAPEGALGLVALGAGKHMNEQVDVDAYFKSVADHEDGFWLKAANFYADHPVLFRRIPTLRRVQEEGWDVHGRML